MIIATFRPRERDALIQSLRTGVTPLLGANTFSLTVTQKLPRLQTSLCIERL